MERINKLDGFADKKVTWDQYLAFQYFLEDLEMLKSHVRTYRFVNKDIFNDMVVQFHKDRTADGTLTKSQRVSDEQVDVIFQMLDLDGNGQLDYDEIIGVLEERCLLASGKGDDLKDIGAAIGTQFATLLKGLRAKIGI